ncbi:acyl-carrier-protein S-malonyltransferase [Hesseltinella vesiculosa]|uniref:[acyl-carrier-protein] S-malonyltransferase n=1 Tax=Hesseltinella vesiculosa TaxID=101127 RepID=A0A1X2G6V6_9FUNG|nr:acyl-carrier-protein S-malonyltransferase [Hesseltinella vesiculosa]
MMRTKHLLSLYKSIARTQKRHWMSVAGIEKSHRALTFPGQGSQCINMGKDIYDRFTSTVKDVYDEADEAMGQSLRAMIFDGDQDTLTLTHNAQPAILTTSIALLRVLEREYGFDLTKACHYVLGHSLGEYTALVAAGALSLGEAVRLTRLRGEAMTRAVQDQGETGMMALVARRGQLDLIEAYIEQLQKELPKGQVIQIANFNSSTQLVLSGTKQGLQEASASLKAQKLIAKAIPLAVSAPFHCTLVQPAEDIMAAAFQSVSWKQPCVEVISNVTAKPYDDIDGIAPLLLRQITSPVKWQQSIEYCKTQDVVDFLCFGPGRVLANMLNKDYPGDSIRPIDTMPTIDEYALEFKDGVALP